MAVCGWLIIETGIKLKQAYLEVRKFSGLKIGKHQLVEVVTGVPTQLSSIQPLEQVINSPYCSVSAGFGEFGKDNSTSYIRAQ